MLSRDDLVVVLGDFGLFWSDPPTEPEREELERLSSRPWTTLFPGRQPRKFYPVGCPPAGRAGFGAPVGVAAPGVFHLEEGVRLHFGREDVLRLRRRPEPGQARADGGKVLGGGGRSPRRRNRRGLGFWSPRGGRCDWILTHTAPEGILKATNLGTLPGDPVSLYLEEIRKETDYKRWFCGHLHRNAYFPGERVHVLRENILEGGTGNIVSVERNRSLLKGAAESLPGAGFPGRETDRGDLSILFSSRPLELAVGVL